MNSRFRYRPTSQYPLCGVTNHQVGETTRPESRAWTSQEEKVEAGIRLKRD